MVHKRSTRERESKEVALTMRRIMLLVAVALVMTLMMASSALSVPAPIASPHQHYLTTPNNEKEVRVGPNVCADPNAPQGLKQGLQ